MHQSFNFKDLALRILVIFLTSLILLFLTRENNFDLHFKMRKVQDSTDAILLVEVTENFSIEEVISNLKSKGVQEIYLSRFLFDESTEQVTPYNVGEKMARTLNLAIPTDGDGITRRVRFLDEDHPKKSFHPLTINYRGPAGTITTVQYFDLAPTRMRLSEKFVVVKSTPPIRQYTTPVGLLSEAELFATILDNLMMNRFIPAKSFLWPVVILFLLLVATTVLLLYLPSTLALVATVTLAITYLSLSLWSFDHLIFWTPIVSPMVQFALSYLLISNYKFVLNEKTRWSLERESVFFNQVEEMKTNFLSLFSHDLKTPLAKIIGIVDTLRAKTTDPEIAKELEKIHQSSRELDRYIKKILKLSQIQSKNISLNLEPTDLNEIIEQAIEQNLHIAQAKSIMINKKLDPLFMVEIDAALIKEVLVNFIENAVTYSPQGSQVNVYSSEIENFLKVSVIDDGPGIPKEFQDNIWEKSFRFDNEKSGYGLGLFLSRYVIERHGGQVYLNSKEKAGSEFGFLLPLNNQEAPNNETA
jgi:signal transduction histidine kinase